MASVELRPRPVHRQQRAEPHEEAKRPGWWQWWLENIKAFAAVAAVIVAGFAFCLNYRAMVGSQRAWVLLDNEGENTLTPQGARLTVRNFGKSPASDVVLIPGVVFEGPRPEPWWITTNPVGGPPTAERLIPPERARHVDVRWAGGADAIILTQLDVDISYRDDFGSYTHHVCVKPADDHAKKLIECEWNERAE